MVETTSLGAALAAGFAVGVWSMTSVKSESDTFISTITNEGKCCSYESYFIKSSFSTDEFHCMS